MAGRYERVNAHDDDDDVDSPVNPRGLEPIPNSPPPSFHSRASSPTRRRDVNPALADAFGSDDEDSDDDVDDRQRLVRQNSTPTVPSSDPAALFQPAQPPAPAPLPSGSRPRVMGGGTGSDGVFANLSARPERDDPEKEKEEQPPSYEQAAADAAPPYWETTILAPSMGGPDEVYVDGMPVGSFFSFLWNCMISASFLVGFLLTYLLHSTHAAKNGSRAGLGITLIQYGFYMKGATDDDPPTMNGPDGYAAPPDPNSHDFKGSDVTDGDIGTVSGGEWLGYVLMVVGWFLLIKSVAEFLRLRRHEQLVLQSPDRGLGVAIIAEGEATERVVNPRSPKTQLLHIALVALLALLVSNLAPVQQVSRISFSPARNLFRTLFCPRMTMAWTCSGATNSALIENMWTNGLITDARVKEAFLKVDRAHYSPTMPYQDSPQPIGHSATISAPHMHAAAIEHVLSYLVPSTSSPAPRRVLDIGSGSGYLTHVLAELVGDSGVVVGLEHIDALRELGENNMGKSVEGRELLRSGKVRFVLGDGRKGWKGEGEAGEEGEGWDVVHVGASAVKVHDELLEQIKAPGCMFIPVDDDSSGYSQHVWRIEKDKDGQVTKKRLFGVRYVPLTDAPSRG